MVGQQHQRFMGNNLMFGARGHRCADKGSITMADLAAKIRLAQER
jgi:hypothetical protein